MHVCCVVGSGRASLAGPRADLSYYSRRAPPQARPDMAPKPRGNSDFGAMSARGFSRPVRLYEGGAASMPHLALHYIYMIPMIGSR